MPCLDVYLPFALSAFQLLPAVVYPEFCSGQLIRPVPQGVLYRSYLRRKLLGRVVREPDKLIAFIRCLSCSHKPLNPVFKLTALQFICQSLPDELLRDVFRVAHIPAGTLDRSKNDFILFNRKDTEQTECQALDSCFQQPASHISVFLR